MVDELMKKADALLDKLLDHNLQFDAQTGAAQIVDELMADRKTMQRGLTAWKKQCDTLTHQVVCCGVAAGHPDATLTTHGAYAGKWNSAQAEEVRKLRAECDQMREERTAWRVTAENAEAAVKQARIDAQAQSCVPAGWVLVPKELTAEMRAAAKPFTTVSQLWESIIAASPQPQPVQPTTDAALHEVRAHLSHINRLLDDAVPIAQAKPERAAQPLTRNQLFEFWDKCDAIPGDSIFPEFEVYAEKLIAEFCRINGTTLAAPQPKD